MWFLTDTSQELSHTLWVVSDLVRYTIDQTKLRWNLDILALLLDNKHWLFLVRDLELVGDIEVLGHTDILIVLKLKK